MSIRDIIDGKSGPAIGDYHGGNGNVYMAHKIVKLQEAHQVDPSSIVSNIFQGCFIFVNGVTKPPLNEIRRLVQIHGGTFHAYQLHTTTHFICDHLPDIKLHKIRELQNAPKLKYVIAKWLTDSGNLI
jgi:DNA repair protein REV1